MMFSFLSLTPAPPHVVRRWGDLGWEATDLHRAKSRQSTPQFHRKLGSVFTLKTTKNSAKNAYFKAVFRVLLRVNIDRCRKLLRAESCFSLKLSRPSQFLAIYAHKRPSFLRIYAEPKMTIQQLAALPPSGFKRSQCPSLYWYYSSFF